MGYYVDNALYSHLKDIKNKKFFYLSKNRWMIVYGNGNLEPKVLIYLAGMSNEEYNSDLIKFSDHENMKIVETLAESVNLPFMFVGFNENVEIMTEVKLIDKETYNFYKVSTADLLKIYESYGLFVDKSMSVKEINKSYSNVYQKWQMSLGGRLVVSDIDLIKLENGSAKFVFELKRSKISLEKWKPYPADYHNFQILSNVFSKANIDFYIVYNHRQEYPFYDDISKLKVFKVNNSKSNFIEFEGYYTLESFLEKFGK